MDNFFRELMESRREMEGRNRRDGALNLIDTMLQMDLPIEHAVAAYNHLYADSTLRVPTNPQTHSDIGAPL